MFVNLICEDKMIKHVLKNKNDVPICGYSKIASYEFWEVKLQSCDTILTAVLRWLTLSVTLQKVNFSQ